jgi:membrane protease YdiL (CAAX protease family)
MNTLFARAVRLPPWPDRRPLASPPPTLRAAAGLIALYFLLQAATGSAIALVMGLLSGDVQISRGIQPVGAEIQHMLARPGMPAILVILVLCVAALSVLALARKKWTVLWSMPLPPGLGLTAPANPAWFAPAVLIGLSAPLLGGWLTAWLAHGQPVTQDIQQLGADTPLLLRVLLVVVVVSVGPLVEELLFRGVLLSALMQRWRAGWSMVITALLFAVVHLPDLRWHWYALPDLALLALALAWLRLRAGSLWPAVLAHGANNLVAVVAWFVVAGPT